MVEIELLAVRDDLPAGGPVLLLREVGGARTIPITIGAREAESIGWGLDGTPFPRPMTHDLLATVVADLGAEVVAVEIVDVRGGTYYADLVLQKGDETLRISARPSDAIALAVRVGAGLLADEDLLEAVGVHLVDEDEDEDDTVDEGEMVEQFREFLEAVQPEDFAP